MLFNSISFAFFMPATFVVYWLLGRVGPRWQNLFILAASCIFYGWWDWRFLLLLLASTAVDYAVGLSMGQPGRAVQRRRKTLLVVSIAVNLGMLGFFKYYDFFVAEFCGLLGKLGLQASPHTLGLVLPLGISFYTFQKLSYTVDIYRGDLEPTRDPAIFFASVCFFPQLLSGPISRVRNLLPQFSGPRRFDDAGARDGLRQMLGGFIKKMVIADNLAPLVKDIFDGYAGYDGLTLLIGTFFFAMQVYCDFSGYSDIAIGVGRLFGIKLMRNFAFPYFSRDVAEFWRRWHISLSTWLRDYLYVPLCGRRPSRGRKAAAIVVMFAICGLWHGANWTYIAWGFLWGLYFLPMTLARRWKRHLGTAGEGRALPSLREAGAMVGTFGLTMLGWIFFRSGTIGDAGGFLAVMVSRPYLGLDYSAWSPMLLACAGLLALEWIQRTRMHMLQIDRLPVIVRWSVYYASAILILVFGAFGGDQFLYTQF